jgi:hypothetical protein
MKYSQTFLHLLKQPDIRYLIQHKSFGQLYEEIEESLVPQFTDFCYNVLNLDVLKYMNYIPKYFLGDSDITDFTIPNTITSIGEGAFYDCNSLKNIGIPNSVKSIGSYVFYDCSSLTNIEIPNSVTNIDKGAFKGCSSLKTIQIPDGVASISEEAFSHCRLLESIEIGDSVTTIGEFAFHNCGSLESVTISNSVTSMGECAFCYCNSLTSIIYKGTTKEALTILKVKDEEWRTGSSIDKIICVDGIIEL